MFKAFLFSTMLLTTSLGAFTTAQARDYMLWARPQGSSTAYIVRVNDIGNGDRVRGTYCGKTLYVLPKNRGYLPRIFGTLNSAGQVKLVNPNYSGVCTIKAR
jgi:hypothetical protein